MDEIVSICAPTMSADGFEKVLVAASSPAAPVARQCYETIASYNIDPAFALAIFKHESSYGKAGIALRSQNWGNLRRGQFGNRIAESFAFYDGPDGWIRSAKDCARLLKRYADGAMGFRCDHPDHAHALNILEHWAPSADGNKPAAYAADVERLVRVYRGNWPVVPPEPSLSDRVKALETEVAAWWNECSRLVREVAELRGMLEGLLRRAPLGEITAAGIEWADEPPGVSR